MRWCIGLWIACLWACNPINGVKISGNLLHYKGNKLYMYVFFEINNEIWQDTDLNKCIKITDTAKRINKKYKQYNFNLKFADDCKEFKSKAGVLYLSPLGLRVCCLGDGWEERVGG